MPDEPTQPAIPEIPEDLTALGDEDVVGLHAQLEESYQALRASGDRTPQVRDAARAIRDAQARLATEMTGRYELATELNTLDAPIAMPEAPNLEPVGTPDTAGDAAASSDAVPAAEDDAEKDKGAPAPAAEPVGAATAGVQLSAEDVIAGRDPQNPGQTVSSTSPPRPASALVAAAGTDMQGQELDFEHLGALINPQLKGPYAKTRLAMVAGFSDTPGLDRASMLSNQNPAGVNDRLIKEAVAAHMHRAFPESFPAPMTAAICDPLDIIREIPDCTTAAEPFSDSLPSRPAGRLGFQFTQSMSISFFDDAVDVFDETDQSNVDPDDSDTWKPCVKLTCPTPDDVTAEAITACFYFDNTTDMSNPERVQDAMKKIAARKARLKTGRLLQLADTFSIHWEAVGPYGALPGFIEMVLSALAQGEYPERLEDGTPYNLYTPPGLLEALVIDRANKEFLTSNEQEEVATYIQGEARAAGWNIRLVDLEDVAVGDSAPFAALPAVNQAFAALPGLGGASHPFKVRLIAPQSALYFSTGEINVGVERSPELNRRNQAQFFMEEYVGLAKHGCHPWFTLDLTLCGNGARAAGVEPFDCTALLT